MGIVPLVISGNPAIRPGRHNPMKSPAALTVALLLTLSACGADAAGNGSTTTTTVPAGLSGSIRVSGGIAGIDETWVLESDGTVLGPDGYVGTLSAADRSSLEATVAAAGFFDLDAEYLPVDQCCDRFTYRVTITRGEDTHTVTTIDAAEAPESLFALIQVFLEAVRPAA